MENRDQQLQILGARVRELRTARGKSQFDLACDCDLDRNYIGMVERGERNPSYLTLLKIAKGLKVNPKELF